MAERADIVLIGAGITGCATAACLLRADPGLRVVLLDRAHVGAGSTSRSMAAFRHQWSVPAHVAFSRHASRIYARMEAEGAAVGFRRNGYLFLHDEPAMFERARARASEQRLLGVKGLLEVLPGDLAESVSCGRELEIDGLAGAVLGTDDGWLDPLAVTQGFLAEARRLGLDYRPRTAVAGIQHERGRLTGVRTQKGDLLETGRAAVCAGPWSAQVARMARLNLPVRPAKRYLYHTRPLGQTPVDMWPLIITPGGAHCRPGEGNTLILAWEARPEPIPDPLPGDDLWESQDLIEEGYGLGIDGWGIAILTRLAAYLPLLGEQASLAHVTCGWYTVTPDQKAILSEDPRLGGLFFATGFSGHGIMHGPATGLCMAELLLDLPPSLLPADDLENQFGLAPLLDGRLREPVEDMVL